MRSSTVLHGRAANSHAAVPAARSHRTIAATHAGAEYVQLISTTGSAASLKASRRSLLLGGVGLQLQLLPALDHSLAADAAPSSSPSLDPSFFADYPYAQPSDILPYIYDTATKGDATAVLNAMDAFSLYYPMYKVGPEKGELLEQQLKQRPPLTALEIGTFLGYSAIRIARSLAAGGLLVCIEANPSNAAVARQLLDYAGIGSSVVVLEGLGSQQLPNAAKLLATARSSAVATKTSTSSTSSSSSSTGDGSKLPQSATGPQATAPAEQAGSRAADFVFLDHCKDCYRPDLQLCEALHVVGPDTLVMADNVLYPGAPGYLEYLDSSGKYTTQLLKAKYEYEQLWNPDWEAGKEDALSASLAVGPGWEAAL